MTTLLLDLAQTYQTNRQAQTAAYLAEAAARRAEIRQKAIDKLWATIPQPIIDAYNLADIKPLPTDDAQWAAIDAHITLGSTPAILRLSIEIPQPASYLSVSLRHPNDNTVGVNSGFYTGDDAFGRDWPDNLGKLVADYLAKAAARDDQLKAEAADYQRKLATAESIHMLATEWHEAETAYQNECQRWAKRWQTSLWEPWSATRLQYIPLLASEYTPDNPLIQTVIVNDELTDSLPYRGRYTRIQTSGILDTIVIGAFLDAEEAHFDDQPDITQSRVNYHRAYHAGKYTVHVPACNFNKPDPAPVAQHAPWYEHVAACLPEHRDWLCDRYYHVDPADLAAKTPEQIVYHYFKQL